MIKFLKKDQNSNSANNEAFSYVNEYGSSRPKDHKENSSKNGKIRDIFFESFQKFFEFGNFYDIFRSMAMKKTLPISKNKW